MLNVVTYITTAKKASPVLSTKPRPSAPVIGDSTDMGEGERKKYIYIGLPTLLLNESKAV